MDALKNERKIRCTLHTHTHREVHEKCHLNPATADENSHEKLSGKLWSKKWAGNNNRIGNGQKGWKPTANGRERERERRMRYYKRASKTRMMEKRKYRLVRRIPKLSDENRSRNALPSKCRADVMHIGPRMRRGRWSNAWRTIGKRVRRKHIAQYKLRASNTTHPNGARGKNRRQHLGTETMPRTDARKSGWFWVKIACSQIACISLWQYCVPNVCWICGKSRAGYIADANEKKNYVIIKFNALAKMHWAHIRLYNRKNGLRVWNMWRGAMVVVVVRVGWIWRCFPVMKINGSDVTLRRDASTRVFPLCGKWVRSLSFG